MGNPGRHLGVNYVDDLVRSVLKWKNCSDSGIELRRRIFGWMSTAKTRPLARTRRARTIVKKPMPGPGSRTFIPGLTYGAR